MFWCLDFAYITISSGFAHGCFTLLLFSLLCCSGSWPYIVVTRLAPPVTRALVGVRALWRGFPPGTAPIQLASDVSDVEEDLCLSGASRPTSASLGPSPSPHHSQKAPTGSGVQVVAVRGRPATVFRQGCGTRRDCGRRTDGAGVTGVSGASRAPGSREIHDSARIPGGDG